MRFFIELSPEQHQRLKKIATRRGKTIRDHILEKALVDEDQRGCFQVRNNVAQQHKETTEKI